MKKILVSSILTSSLLLASDFSIDSIGLNLGKSNSDYTQTNHSGAIILGNTPKESFNSYELFATLKSEIYGMKPYISYTHSFNAEMKQKYVLVGLNKYYKLKSFTPYAGVVLGYGQLDWRYDPLNTSKNINNDANSLIGGLQAGMNYSLTSKLSLGLSGKYLFHNYETKLDPSTDPTNSTIEHKKTSVLALNIRYSF